MTEKEKAKAYDEAIERTKKLYSNEIAEEIFPELKESEDEKIRKEIISILRNAYWTSNKNRFNELVAWLENQRDKDKLIQELGEYKVKYTQEVLEKYINNTSNKDDERLRKTAIAFLKDFAEKGYENAVECIDWLEKKGKKSSWKPSKEEMDALYSLSYITNEYDERKEDVITHLYQDLKQEFFNNSSYENMFSLDNENNKEDDIRRRSTIQVLEYARSLGVYNQYGKADIDKNIAWLKKQGEQTPSQTNEHAWLYLVSDVLTWKDGIGQYLDDPRVQELAKRLSSKYAQKLYNPSVRSNSSNAGKNKQKTC